MGLDDKNPVAFKRITRDKNFSPEVIEVEKII